MSDDWKVMVATLEAPEKPENPFAAEMRRMVREKLIDSMQHREELLTAWLVKTGVDPEDAVLHEQTLSYADGSFTTRVWVTRKADAVPALPKRDVP